VQRLGGVEVTDGPRLRPDCSGQARVRGRLAGRPRWRRGDGGCGCFGGGLHLMDGDVLATGDHGDEQPLAVVADHAMLLITHWPAGPS